MGISPDRLVRHWIWRYTTGNGRCGDGQSVIPELGDAVLVCADPVRISRNLHVMDNACSHEAVALCVAIGMAKEIYLFGNVSGTGTGGPC